MKRKWFHAWLVPLLWLPCGALLVVFPGDLNWPGYFATFPGAWAPEILNLHVGLPALASQAVGAFFVVVLLGLLMDLAGVNRQVYVYYATFALLVIACLIACLGFGWINVSALLWLFCWTIYFVGILSILAAAGYRLLTRERVLKMIRNPKTVRIVIRVSGAALLLVATIWGVMFVDFYKILSPRPHDFTRFSFMWMLAVVLFAFAGLGLMLRLPWSRLPAMCIVGAVGGYITFVMFDYLSILGVAIMLPFIIGILILLGTNWIKSGFDVPAKTNENSQQTHATPTSEAAQSATHEKADV